MASHKVSRIVWVITEQFFISISSYGLLFLGARHWSASEFASYVVAITVGWLVTAVVSAWSILPASIILIPGSVAGSSELAAVRRIQLSILLGAVALMMVSIICSSLWLAAAGAACARVAFESEKRIEIAFGSLRYVGYSAAVNITPLLIFLITSFTPEHVLQLVIALFVIGTWIMRRASMAKAGTFNGYACLFRHGGWFLASSVLDWVSIQGHLVYAAYFLSIGQIAEAAAVRAVSGILQTIFYGIEQMIVPHLRSMENLESRNILLSRVRIGLLFIVGCGTFTAWWIGDWLMAFAFPILNHGLGYLLVLQISFQVCAVLAWIEMWRVKGEARIDKMIVAYLCAAIASVPSLICLTYYFGSAAVLMATGIGNFVFSLVMIFRNKILAVKL